VTRYTTKKSAGSSKPEDSCPVQESHVKMNGETMLGCSIGISATPDPDTIYYTTNSIAAILDVSFAGPLYPLESIVEHIEGRCMREGSFSALSMFKETIDCVGIVALEHLVFAIIGRATCRWR
jgi:hypothetical protein